MTLVEPVSVTAAIPFSVEGLAREFGTPTWVYVAETIEQRISEMQKFDKVRYAQKANSNLAILTLMRSRGVVVDAVTAGELARALRVGFDPAADEVIYTADLFDNDALDLIREHSIPVNVGSPDMIDQLGEAGIDVPVTLRINPGFGHGHSQKVNTGGDHSKHGIWHTQIGDCLERAAAHGLKVRGLHMHIGSGSDFTHLSKVCHAMVDAARVFGNDSDLKTISAGGGLPIPYKKDDATRIDLDHYFDLWDQARKEIESMTSNKIELEVEPGRYLVAESGYLVTQIRSAKQSGDNGFIIIDAGFSDLVRPAMYGAYHHISIAPANGREPVGECDYVVAGPLCESCDVFTQEEGGFVTSRLLPEARVGDYLVLHDAGAYGMAMSSNYNSRRHAAEVMVKGGQAHLIRQRQTLESLMQFDIVPDGLA